MVRQISEISSQRRVIASVTVLLSILFGPATWAADSGMAAPPAWVSKLTILPAGDAVEVVPCRLDFTVSWSKVVVAGKTRITIGGLKDERYPGKLIGVSEGGSRGAARLIWPYDHSFTSVMDPQSLRPIAFHSVEIDRKETLWTTNRYGRSGADIKAVTLRKKDGRREEKTEKFPFPQVHDLMSAFLYARSLTVEVGDEVVVLVHPFGSAYIVRFTMLGQEKHRIGLGEFDAMKVDLQISKVKSDLSLEKYTKFKRATAWISNDEYRMPLEVRADIFVGSIRVILKGRELLGE